MYRTLPSANMEKIAAGFKKHNFHGLVIVGGFEVSVVKTFHSPISLFETGPLL